MNTEPKKIDVVYSWDNNVLRATPHGKPFASASCVHFSGGGRNLKPQELFLVALNNFSGCKIVKFVYLKQGQGHILPKKK